MPYEPRHGPWFPPLDDLYADDLEADREIFQGDVFRDVVRVRYGVQELADDRAPSPRGGRGLAMVLGHPCEISPTEKGAQYPWRTTCAVIEDKDSMMSLDGRGQFYAFPLPDLFHDERTWYADFRALTVIHDDWLTVDKRVASLSEKGWYALQRRYVYFVTRVEMHPQDIADAAVDQSGKPLHPGPGSSLAAD